jgi:conjugal transfer ATP-binding protein TraC
MRRLIGDEERDVAQIPGPFLMHYGIFIPKQEGPKAKTLTKAAYVERQACSPIGKYLPSIMNEYQELQFVRQQLEKGERIVQTQFTITLFAAPDKMPAMEQTLLNLYKSVEWQLQPNRFLHLPLFLSSFPMMWSEPAVRDFLLLDKMKTTLSTEVPNLLPMQGEWRGTHSAGMLLAGRSGQIATWSPFDNNQGNYNAIVVGRSGSGKSVFMQEMMVTVLSLGGRVFVLDVGRSFEKSCFMLEGQFVEFSTRVPLCLNPFSTIKVGDPEAEEDALAMLKSVLALMAAPTRGIEDIESAILQRAMLAVWTEYKQGTTITRIADFLIQQPDKLSKDLGTMLFPYTALGNYGRFFNGISNVNLDNPLVVIELEELKERKDLQAVVVQMLIIDITNRMFLETVARPLVLFLMRPGIYYAVRIQACLLRRSPVVCVNILAHS